MGPFRLCLMLPAQALVGKAKNSPPASLLGQGLRAVPRSGNEETNMPFSTPSRVVVFAVLALVAACQNTTTGQQAAISGAAQTGELVAVLAAAPGQGAQYQWIRQGHFRERSSSVVQRALASCYSERCKVVQQWRQGECIGVVWGERYIWWNDNSSRTLNDALISPMKLALPVTINAKCAKTCASEEAGLLTTSNSSNCPDD